jgi:predicted metal-dependent hydrolase
MNAVINYGKRKIHVRLIERNRKTLAITVKPDETVEIYMPAGADSARVLRRAGKKAKWMAKYLDYFEKNKHLAAKKEYVSGESHSLMGKKYRLRIRKSVYEKIKVSGDFIYLYVNDIKNSGKKKALLYNWYKWQAEKRFAVILASRIKRLKAYKIALPEFYIKYMKTRWGSCSPRKGRINLNLELIKTPKECIEYIIDHELIHFIHRSHDRNYYEMLSKTMPDWKERKNKLERYEII